MKVQTSRFALASAFLLVAAAISQAVTLSASVVNTVELHNSIFGYSAPGAAAPTPLLLDAVIAPGLYSTTADVTGDATSYLSYTYTLFSTYVSGGVEGVVVGLNATSAATATAGAGLSFTSVFGAATSESSLVTAIDMLHSNPTDFVSGLTLLSFYNANKSKFLVGVTPGTLVGFSNGHNVGTIVAAPVPEPAPMAALGLGCIALVRRRRQRSAG